MINEYNKRVKNSAVFEPRTLYEGFIGRFDVTFKEVEKKHYPEYFGWSKWLCGGEGFRVLQLINPGTAGFGHGVKMFQRILNALSRSYTQTNKRVLAEIFL